MEKSKKKVAVVAPVIRERKCPLLNDPSREGFSLSAGSLGHKKGGKGGGRTGIFQLRDSCLTCFPSLVNWSPPPCSLTAEARGVKGEGVDKIDTGNSKKRERP